MIAVANPLRGLESDAEYLRSVLDTIEGPIVIAGHSYGGSVMSHAAEGNPNVTALVYVASFLAEPGESLARARRKFPGAELGGAAQPDPYRTPDGSTATELYIDQEQYRHCSPPTSPRPSPSRWPPPSAPSRSAPSTPPRRVRPGVDRVWVLSAAQGLAIPAELLRFMASGPTPTWWRSTRPTPSRSRSPAP